MSSGPAAAAVGGPVIIGGDDLTDHGGISEGGVLQDGWLYIRKALENIAPKVTRANDGSVAAIGSEPSEETSSDAGAAIGKAAPQAGLTVTFHEGATAIDTFFAALAAGTAKPKIIWISGTGAANDLDSSERAALTTHATQIASFVNSGGGLMSHGSAYGWLFAVLPQLTSVNSGGDEGDLQLTAAGTAAFPGVTNANIGAGPWHNHFEGDFGGLQILATSMTVLDANDNPAAVLIGGAAVQLGPPAPAAPASRAQVTVTSPSCGQAIISATGVTPGLPHQIVVTPSAGGAAFVVNVTALADEKVTATVDLKTAFGGSGGGSFTAFVRMSSNQVTVSNTEIFTAAACPTPTPTPKPATPTPKPTPTPTPAPIAQLPSTTTGADGGLPISALAAMAIFALAAVAWKKRESRT